MKKRLFSLALVLIMALSLLPVTAFAADPKAVKIGNITLSDVVITDEFETAWDAFGTDNSMPEREFLYNLGDVGFWQNDLEEYGYSTFWCYLLPEDATVTIHLTEEAPQAYIYPYTLEEVEGWSRFSRGWKSLGLTGWGIEWDGTQSEVDFRLTAENTRNQLQSQGLTPAFDLLRIVQGDENILIWFGGPSVSSSSFTDVPAGEYYAAPVAWAVKEGITNGTSATTFSPSKECSQVEIITFLWRAAGKPSSSTKAPITVASYYQDAVNWAYSKHFISDSFTPDTPCSRLQAVLYIWMALDWPKATKTTATFTDLPNDESLLEAVSWAVEAKVTNGTSDTTFSPGKVCNRGEIVTFLYRAYTN